MTVSGGMGITNTITTNAGQGVSVGQTLTFATGGATIVVGDVEAGDTPVLLVVLLAVKSAITVVSI